MKRAICAGMIAIVLLSMIPFDADADNADAFLIDYGNGETIWLDVVDGTYRASMTSSATAEGVMIGFDPLSVDGLTERTTGTVVCKWRVYVWNGAWNDVTSMFDPDSERTGHIAIGFYPADVLPTETPDRRSSWTMIRGDSSNSGALDASLSTESGSVSWTHSYGSSNYVDETPLVKGDHVYIVAGGGYTATSAEPTVYCYDRFTGDLVWAYSYDRGIGYETATGAIYGDYLYLPATNGHLYRIPLAGPGDDGADVVSIEIPTGGSGLTGTIYRTGASSLIYDSGVLYFGASCGKVYCLTMNLDVIWTADVGGCVYYNTPAVVGDNILMGALDGKLYVIDRFTGDVTDSCTVYTAEYNGRTYGSANVPIVVGDYIMVSFSDGRGMNSTKGGIASYRLENGSLTEIARNEFGLTGNYLTPVVTDGFSGVYYLSSDSLYRMPTDCKPELMASDLGTFKGPITLVNGDILMFAEYEIGGCIYMTDLQGKVLGKMSQPADVAQYCMTPTVVIDGMFYLGTDGGAFGYNGALPTIEKEGDKSSSGWGVVFLIVVILAVIAIAYVSRGRIAALWRDDGRSKVRRNKKRLLAVIILGLATGFAIFIVTLCYGPSGSYGPSESLSILWSALCKTIGGESLNYDETIIFDSRCSRAIAAFAVGVGLSVSGAVYQAIIRNPMVDPYIMGVSAGAGVAAVAVIAFDFTLFGLLDSVTYVTPVVAMIGGLAAFACTMLLAEKAGGSSINYVLAGVIIGLVFSALQTLMLSMAGNKLNDAMSWLFGSFANITWTQTVLVFFPAITMSLVTLVWAKEFNLVLLGEDQARQMGLDVRTFDRWMLVLASVLASVCVAFVGIIGFVGMVVPHLSRMILGGDHRLVLPSSMVIGGALMMAADLFAKMAMSPLELPVGAITTVIGAPLFAYLLIKKGRIYDG